MLHAENAARKRERQASGVSAAREADRVQRQDNALRRMFQWILQLRSYGSPAVLDQLANVRHLDSFVAEGAPPAVFLADLAPREVFRDWQPHSWVLG